MGIELHPGSQFTPDPDIQTRVLDGEAVLLNIQTGAYFGLNKVSTHIWELYSEGRSLEEVIQGVLERFEVEPDQASADVYTFTESLIEQGLMSQVPHPTN